MTGLEQNVTVQAARRVTAFTKKRVSKMIGMAHYIAVSVVITSIAVFWTIESIPALLISRADGNCMIELVKLCYRCPLIHKVETEATDGTPGGPVCAWCKIESMIADARYYASQERFYAPGKELSDWQMYIEKRESELAALGPRILLNIS